MGFFKRSWSKLFCRNEKAEDRTMGEQQAGLLKDVRPVKGFKMYLNKGCDDEMAICGYRRSTFRMCLTYLFIAATAGLLRLVFHWVPHLYLRATSIECDVIQAQYLLITEIYNKNHKIYHVKPLKVLTADMVHKLKKKGNLLKLQSDEEADEYTLLSVHFGNGIFTEIDRLLMFTCKKVTYFWHASQKEFVKLRGLDHGVSSEILHSNKAGLSKSEQFMRKLVYGPNEIQVRESPILTLLFLEVLNPFYVFQVFSFILWFVDNYYYYAAAILAMSMFGITMTVIQTRRNQRNLKSTVQSSDVCKVLRPVKKSLQDGSGEHYTQSELISTEHLVPGDILEIPANGCMMQCDALLLTGNCILNESMLTGESVPVTKTPFPNLPDSYYDPKEHARHTLFCGTHVIQTRYFGGEKVLAVVIRTGFSTAKGGLVRSILYPPPVDFRFEKDSYRFVALLAFIAGIGFIYTVVTKILRGIPARDIVLEALDLITIVVPPALPAAMTVGRFYAQNRLQKNKIFCISPRSINVSGSIDCVCFDKTGTLTEDGLDLLCVVPIEGKEFLSSVRNVEILPYNVFVCGLVSCHSLTIINKQITGDPLDLKMFESTKWSIEDPDISDNSKFNMIFPTVLRPPKRRQAVEGLDDDFDYQIGIIREFPFSSSAQRMGVIIRKLSGSHFEYYCKGSPEMILNFVRADTVPDDFHDTLESYTQEGYRVIALAHKELKMSYTKVQKVQRDAVEKDLSLLGLIVLENRLKEDTTPCIHALNEAKIRVIMVTGDNILTALSVARDCGIVTQGQSVITVNCDSEYPPRLYFTLTATKNAAANNDLSLLSNSASIVSLDTIESQTVTNNTQDAIVKRPQTLFNNYRFAITGKVWTVVREFYPELVPRLVTRGSIFARMSPEQKQQLIQELQSLGYYVAMCGDGANDCGALKAAHTGISLSEAESSVASPFTSKNPNITCVLDVIREGRAALVTSFGIFKYMAAYSMCQFISVMILYSIDSNLTDIEFLYIDLFIISIFAFFFGRTAAYDGKLVPETPLNSLISFTPIISLLLQLLLLVFFQVLSFEHLKTEEWFVPFNTTTQEDKDNVACLENYTLFTISGFQYIILAIVFSKGRPYRKSIFSNYGLIISAVLVTAFSVYMAFGPLEFLREKFELIVPDDVTFRLYLIGYAFLNFVVSLLVEIFIVDHLVFKKLRFKFHNIDKSKRKYLAIERDLDSDSKWPVLTSSFRSAASPLTPMPSCTAEIVIETKKQYDPKFVLKSLLQVSPSSNSSAFVRSNESNPNVDSFGDLSIYMPDQTDGAVSSVTNDKACGKNDDSAYCEKAPAANFQAHNGSAPPDFKVNSENSLCISESSQYDTPSRFSSLASPFSDSGNLSPDGKLDVVSLNEVHERNFATPVRSKSHSNSPFHFPSLTLQETKDICLDLKDNRDVNLFKSGRANSVRQNPSPLKKSSNPFRNAISNNHVNADGKPDDPKRPNCENCSNGTCNVNSHDSFHTVECLHCSCQGDLEVANCRCGRMLENPQSVSLDLLNVSSFNALGQSPAANVVNVKGKNLGTLELGRMEQR